MNIAPIQTRVLKPPKDDLLETLKNALPEKLPEQSIIAISSKVVSVWQGRCVEKSAVESKDALVAQEAEYFLPRSFTPGRHSMHTMSLKQGVLLASAGIDESNANDYYILSPRNPSEAAQTLWQFLRETYRMKDVGVIVVDSHCVPLRRGTIGVSLGFFGFVPLHDYRGTKDLFGRKFTVSVQNLADGLAAAAVLVMGEGAEQTPVALITELNKIEFSDKPYQPKTPSDSFIVPREEDIFAPFLNCAPWEKGRGDEE